MNMEGAQSALFIRMDQAASAQQPSVKSGWGYAPAPLFTYSAGEGGRQDVNSPQTPQMRLL